MTWAPGPVVTRRRLGGELRRLREAAGLRLDDVARQLECSTSKISRLETGKGLPRWRDVRDLLDVYGVAEGDERERLLEWSKTGQAKMWWQDYADVLPGGFDNYIELEWDASRVRAYEPYIVHGLLQTREYAHTVLRAAWEASRSAAEIQRMVDVRLQRQEALAPDHGLTFTCVLDESTLYRVVGSPRIQKAQLDHLIGMAEAQHVDVRVLPFSAGLVAPNLGSFAVLAFADALEGSVTHVERFPTAGDYLADAETIEGLGRQWTALCSASYTEQESIPLLKHAVRTLVDA